MPCDGSHVLFIGGYHHSGTGAVTHALKTHALGLHSPGIDAEVRDRWPPASLACAETWQVWKHPTNVASEVHKMLGLRRVYPNMTLVFLERDLPNVVWSIIKRFKSWRGEALVHRRDDWCAVRHAWLSRPPHHRHPLDFDVDLEEFSADPRPAVQRIVPVPTRVNATFAVSNASLTRAHLHYGANRGGEFQDPVVLTDAELGVLPYNPYGFVRELESPAWQQKIHMPGRLPGASQKGTCFCSGSTCSSLCPPNSTALWGSHGPTDVANLTATLLALKCSAPLLNGTEEFGT